MPLKLFFGATRSQEGGKVPRKLITVAIRSSIGPKERLKRPRSRYFIVLSWSQGRGKVPRKLITVAKRSSIEPEERLKDLEVGILKYLIGLKGGVKCPES